MSDIKRELVLYIRYRDKQAKVNYNSTESLIIGRKFLQSLFSTNGKAFRNISRQHIEFYFDAKKEQFWAKDSSLLGTLVRVIGSNPDELGPEFLYQHEKFLIKRRMRVRLQNEDENRDPDDIIIEVENQAHDETRPILHTPAYWDRLLKQLHSVRAAHLVGLPGTGKSTLARKLMASQGTTWQRKRDRELGGGSLVAWIDCHLMDDEDNSAWKRLARRMLVALQTAAEDNFYYDIRDEIQSAINYFDSNVSRRIGQMNPVFRQALRAVVSKGLRPVFVFDHFDVLYQQLDKFMLYQLYQFHQWPELGEMLRYVIITQRPFDFLRNDNKNNGVIEFYNLFARYSIQMACWGRDDFRILWGQVAPGYSHVAASVLTELYQLCGGHPGLSRELYEELAINGWLDQPDQWLTRLKQVDWQARPSQSCMAVWENLISAEKEAIYAHLDQKTLSPESREKLFSIGIFNHKGDLFSPIFTNLVIQMRYEHQNHAKGLLIDPKLRRVFVDGEDVTAKLQGRKLEVLLYMFENANDLCDYESLIQFTLPENTKIEAVYLESERSALQRTVSRLCRIVDPRREHIQNEQGRGYMFVSPS